MPNDPYKYFRVEARELLDGLTEGVLELEKGGVEQDRIAGMLRLAHTLKGAARVVKQPAMAELAHGMEDLLSPFRGEAHAVPSEQAHHMLKTLDQLAGRLAALSQPCGTGASPAAARPANPEPLETVRIQVEEVEA